LEEEFVVVLLLGHEVERLQSDVHRQPGVGRKGSVVGPGVNGIKIPLIHGCKS
jgi:hypothetical protein